MKSRIGFVSNSSSTSFVCCYCGDTYTAMDDQYGEACPVCCHPSDKYPDGFVEFVMREQGLVPEVWVRRYWRSLGESAKRIC